MSIEQTRWMRGVALAGVVATLLFSGGVPGQARLAAAPGRATVLAGPSWLRALAITVDTTPLGHLGGSGPSPRGQDQARFQESVRRALTLAGGRDAEARRALETPFTVDGEEIYRLNCRACHGPRGAGLPPEVASILGLGGALSPALIEQSVRARGLTVRPSLARELSLQAEQSLRARLRNGGKEMPPLLHLSEAETEALIDYLQVLAGAPRAGLRNLQVVETGLRIGEHVIQGTCRICHDAAGPGAGHLMMASGRIPALANLPEQLSLDGVVHKVRHGWTSPAGLMQHLSRMPVFAYLSDEEVAAAYLYLAYQPPLG